MSTPMTDQASAGSDSALVVEQAFAALQAGDFDKLGALLADDVVYVNVGLPASHGRAATMKVMKATRRIRLEVKVYRTVTEGAAVLNERTDVIGIGPLRLQFWVCGVFEVHDGRITLWRDYFDFYDFARNGVRGVAGMVFPTLRPAMP